MTLIIIIFYVLLATLTLEMLAISELEYEWKYKKEPFSNKRWKRIIWRVMILILWPIPFLYFTAVGLYKFLSDFWKILIK